MTGLEYGLLAAVTALYILGTYQGNALAEIIENVVLDKEHELSPGSRFLLKWGWPVATVRAMLEKVDD